MHPDRMHPDRMRPDSMAADRALPDRLAADGGGRDRMPAERGGRDRMPAERGDRDRMPAERSSRPVRTGAPPQARGAAFRRDAGSPRGPEGRRPAEARAAGRGIDDAAGRSQPAAAESRGRLPGTVAVIGIFLITLAGAAADSFVGIGLGLITLVCLVASTVAATLLVRRGDLVSVVLAPPLVFVAVAAVNIGLAPSAHFNLATVATLLVRGFPTMAIATGAAIVLTLIRLAARR
jgi:hypothetical protein